MVKTARRRPWLARTAAGNLAAPALLSVPLMLKPPNGCAPTMAPVILRLKYRLPTWNSARACSSRAGRASRRRPSGRTRCRWRWLSACVVVARPDKRQHRPEDLLLRERPSSGTSAKIGWLDVPAVRPPARRRPPAGPRAGQSPRSSGPCCTGCWSMTAAICARRVLGWTHPQRLGPLGHTAQHVLIDRLEHDRARRGRALLPLEAERGGGDALGRRVEVRASRRR